MDEGSNGRFADASAGSDSSMGNNVDDARSKTERKRRKRERK